MKAVRRLIRLTIALHLLAVTTAFPQATSEDVRPWETGECLFRTPVLDEPFAADAVTTWHPPAKSGLPVLRSTARYYRDRAGRVRVEQMFAGVQPKPGRIFVASEPASRVVYVLDPVKRIAAKGSRQLAAMLTGAGCTSDFVLPLSAGRAIAFLQGEMHVPIFEEALEPRLVTGVPAVGVRLRMLIPPALVPPGARSVELRDERWVSPELKVMVAYRAEDSEIGVLDYRLTNVERVEPPAQLFQLPASYAVMELPSALPHGWLNPYRLDGTRLELHGR